jgi:long-subunit acyl-CoA synthetase (AMP-forming)
MLDRRVSYSLKSTHRKNKEGVMVETLSQLFLNTLKSYPKDDLLLSKKEGKYVPISTAEFAERVKYFCLGLKDLGLEAGDKLIILSENRPKWIISDLANLCLGGITVPIYTTLAQEQIRYIIDDCYMLKPRTLEEGSGCKEWPDKGHTLHHLRIRRS